MERRHEMNKRNYRELWEQLKAIILFGKQQRWERKELYELMSNLELNQLAQDPLAEILKVGEAK